MIDYDTSFGILNMDEIDMTTFSDDNNDNGMDSNPGGIDFEGLREDLSY
jgi:hypothetical protein